MKNSRINWTDHTANFWHGCFKGVSLLSMDEWDWHRVLDVNLTGAFLMSQSAARLMSGHGSGVIIHLLAGAESDERPEAAYVASMAGLAGLARQMARELHPLGIQVHGVQAGQEQVVEVVLALLEEA